MALGTLRKRAVEKRKAAPPETKEIEVQGESLRFRSFESKDLYPHPKRIERLMRDYAGLAPQQRVYILLFGSTYFMTDADRALSNSADVLFAEIATSDTEMWLELLAAHQAAFPDSWRLLVGDLNSDESDEEDLGDSNPLPPPAAP
jgi:hypothetical protein